MSTKVLGGTYCAGYTLSSRYSTLSITSTGRATGKAGAAGASGPTGEAGDAGGAGVSVFDATVFNQGRITGGAGESAGKYTGDTIATRSDGHGGTDVTLGGADDDDPPPAPASPVRTAYAMISAIASLGAPTTSAAVTPVADLTVAGRPPLLAMRAQSQRSHSPGARKFAHPPPAATSARRKSL